MHNKVPQYLSSFLPNTSLATNRYPIRHPRLQSPFHSHAFISQTCKYNLPVLLNSINNQSDELTVIVRNVDNTSLSGFKKATKSYLLSVPFRIATFVRFNHFIPHCFVLCAANIALSIIELFIWIDFWQMVLFFLNLFKKNMLLLIRDCLFYGYPLTCFILLLYMYADKNHLSHIIIFMYLNYIISYYY